MKKYQLVIQKEGYKQFITAAEYGCLALCDRVLYRLILPDERDKLINIIDTQGEPNILGQEFFDRAFEERGKSPEGFKECWDANIATQDAIGEENRQKLLKAFFPEGE